MLTLLPDCLQLTKHGSVVEQVKSVSDFFSFTAIHRILLSSLNHHSTCHVVSPPFWWTSPQSSRAELHHHQPDWSTLEDRKQQQQKNDNIWTNTMPVSQLCQLSTYCPSSLNTPSLSCSLIKEWAPLMVSPLCLGEGWSRSGERVLEGQCMRRRLGFDFRVLPFLLASRLPKRHLQYIQWCSPSPKFVATLGILTISPSPPPSQACQLQTSSHRGWHPVGRVLAPTGSKWGVGRKKRREKERSWEVFR